MRCAAYERWRKLFRDSEGRVHVRGERVARQHRMNIGTIVEAPLVKVRLVGKRRFGPVLGEVEEYFVNLLRPATRSCSPAGCCASCGCTRTWWNAPRAAPASRWCPPTKAARLPLTTNLADRVRGLLQRPAELGRCFPKPVQDWLRLQKARSRLPGRSDLLVETFPRGDRWYLVAYCFEGRNAHQTLGMLLTRRMERAGYAPLGFVATDYVLGVWSADQPTRRREAVRSGHAGRRPGGVAGGKLHAAAHLPQRRGDRRADRAAPSRARRRRAGR